MSKAISAGQAKNYYQKEYTSAKENYYSEGGEVNGRCSGELAEEWTSREKSKASNMSVAPVRTHTRRANSFEYQIPESAHTTTAKNPPHRHIGGSGDATFQCAEVPFHSRRFVGND